MMLFSRSRLKNCAQLLTGPNGVGQGALRFLRIQIVAAVAMVWAVLPAFAEQDLSKIVGLANIPHVMIDGEKCYIFSHKMLRGYISTGVSNETPKETFLDGECVVTVGNATSRDSAKSTLQFINPELQNAPDYYLFLTPPVSVVMDTLALSIYLHPDDYEWAFETIRSDGCGDLRAFIQPFTACTYVVAGRVRKLDVIAVSGTLKTRAIDVKKIKFLKKADGIDLNLTDIVGLASKAL